MEDLGNTYRTISPMNSCSYSIFLAYILPMSLLQANTHWCTYIEYIPHSSSLNEEINTLLGDWLNGFLVGVILQLIYGANSLEEVEIGG